MACDIACVNDGIFRAARPWSVRLGLEGVIVQENEKQLVKTEGLATSLLYHGDDLYNDGREDEALACYIGSEQLARQGGFHEITLLSLQRRVSLHSGTGNLALAERVAREGIHFSVSIDDMDSLLSFQGRMCAILRRRGILDEAMEVAFTGLEVAQNERAVAEEFSFLNHIIAVSIEQDDKISALRMAKCGMRRAMEHKNLQWTALFLTTIGSLEE